MSPPGLNILEEGEQKNFALVFLHYLGLEGKTTGRLWCSEEDGRLFGIYSFLVCEFIPDGPFKIDPILNHFAWSEVGPSRKPSFPLWQWLMWDQPPGSDEAAGLASAASLQELIYFCPATS